MSLLEVDALNCHYGDFQALFGVSVNVEEGETVAVIGANGAGKSTLLDSIAGLLRPSAGDVRFDGASVSALGANVRTRRGISLVPEGRRIFPSLSVTENLLVGGYPKRPGPWGVERVFALFPFLAERARSRGWMLSGGEQQALAIGRALMANPRLLLLDEVSLGLAPVAVKRLYDALPSIMGEGTTLVLVEQDIGQALKVAGRIYCLLEGRVSLHGRPRTSRASGSSKPTSGWRRDLGQHGHPGHPAGRALRTVRRGAVARLRGDARGQPRAR